MIRLRHSVPGWWSETGHPGLVAFTCTVLLGTMFAAPQARAAEISFVGTHFDIGGTFFPGGGPADVTPYVTVPWRSDSPANVFAVSDESPNRYYGTAGYAMFATRFDYPDAGIVGGNAFVPITGDGVFENLYDMPGWVAGSQILAERLAGGFAYALVDDPRLQAGVRHWTFDGVNYPPANGENHTGQNPYVKLGVIAGVPLDGRVDAGGNPDRWEFTVGDNVPAHFRLGVMTDGMDNEDFATPQVFLRQVGGESAGTDFMPIQSPGGRNRFVDMSFFDVVGAQPGDVFVISAVESGGGARLSGFSFDVVSDAPPVVAGDFNGDGNVDGADFVVWQTNFPNNSGIATLSMGDANGDGNVDGADFVVWQTNFPTVAPTATVPEPSAWLLALAGGLALVGVRRR